jgi:prophage DNA circulation protein
MADIIKQIAGALGIDLLETASFRGVTFDCLSTSDTLEKDIVAYTFPYRDGAEVEDQGMKAMTFRITALFWGDDYQTQLKGFLKAAKESGAGELIHPMWGSIPKAQLVNVGIEHEIEPLNAVTVELNFIEATTEQALFTETYAESLTDTVNSLTDGMLGSAAAAFADAVNTLNTVKQDVARVTNILSTAQYVITSLEDNIKTTVGSTLDLFSYPGVFVNDVKSLTTTFTDSLSLISSTVVSDFEATQTLCLGAIALPEQLASMQNFSTSASGDGVFASPLTRASIMPQSDRRLVTQTTRLTVLTELAEVASDIFLTQSTEPTLSTQQVERLTNNVRSMIEDAIIGQREIIADKISAGISDGNTTADTDVDASLVSQLQALAYSIQAQARSLILTLPPLVTRSVTRACNVHLLAFDWYGDADRADELVRLNPAMQNPNALKPGDVLNAFAK